MAGTSNHVSIWQNWESKAMLLTFYRFTILFDAGPRGESPSVLAGQLEPGQLETQKLRSLTVPGLCLDRKIETLLTGVASKTQTTSWLL